MTGVSLVVGDTLPYESYAENLCQRYYEVIASGSSKEISGGNYYNSSSIHSLYFLTEKIGIIL